MLKIEFVTRKMQEDGIRTNINIGAGSYGSIQTEATNRIRKGRFSSTVTASYNRTDGHRADMAFEQYGGYAKLGYDFTDNWKVWGDVNVTRFNATNPGSVMKPYIDNDQRITRGMTSFALENYYEKTSGALSFFYNWGDHWINDGYQPGGEPLQYRFNSNDQMLGVSWYQSVQLFQGNRLTVGADYFHFGGEAWNQFFDGHRETSANKSLNEVAGYVDFRQDIAAWLTLDAGARVDYHSQTGTEFIPQVGLAFHLPENVEIKAMASKGFRNPTIREMYMFPPQNPDLKPEKLWNYEIGMKYFSSDYKFNLNAALFYIDWKDQQIFVMGMMGPGIKNAGDAHSLGGEMDLRWEFLPNLTYILSAGYSHAEYYHNLDKSHEGNRIVMAPEFTGNTGFIYQKAVKTSCFRSFAASTTVTGFGTQYFDEANLLKQKPYFLCKYADFRIWGKNILDKAFFTYMLNNPVGQKLPIYNDMGQSGAPARFGASVTFKI